MPKKPTVYKSHLYCVLKNRNAPKYLCEGGEICCRECMHRDRCSHSNYCLNSPDRCGQTFRSKIRDSRWDGICARRERKRREKAENGIEKAYSYHAHLGYDIWMVP